MDQLQKIDTTMDISDPMDKTNGVAMTDKDRILDSIQASIALNKHKASEKVRVLTKMGMKTASLYRWQGVLQSMDFMENLLGNLRIAPPKDETAPEAPVSTDPVKPSP